MTDEAPNNAHMAMHLQPSSTTLAAADAGDAAEALAALQGSSRGLQATPHTPVPASTPTHALPGVRVPGMGRGSSLYRGVSKAGDKKKWRAMIQHNHEQHHVGYYPTAEEAARAYDRKALLFMGPSAITNFPAADYDGVNLEADGSVEEQMRKRKRTKTSQFRGVTRAGAKWRAAIRMNNIKRELGIFDTEAEAARVYDAEALQMFGPNATLNYASPAPAPSSASAPTAEGLPAAAPDGAQQLPMLAGGPPAYQQQPPHLNSAMPSPMAPEAEQEPASLPNRYLGVRPAGNGQYISQVVVDLGKFNSEEEAAAAYDRASVWCLGLTSRLNFPAEQQMGQDGSIGTYTTEQEAETAGAFAKQNFVAQMAAASAGQPAGSLQPSDSSTDQASTHHIGLPAALQNPSNPSRPDKLSRFIGLSKKHNRWKALIKVHGKRKELGSFTTEEAAARCYDRHAVLAWGARARTNFNALELMCSMPDDAQVILDAMREGKGQREAARQHMGGGGLISQVVASALEQLPNLVDSSTQEGQHAHAAIASALAEQNTKKKSAYRGVHANWSRWRAQIYVGGRRRELGSFDTETEAARAYDFAAISLYGSEKAKTNFPAQEYLSYFAMPANPMLPAEPLANASQLVEELQQVVAHQDESAANQGVEPATLQQALPQVHPQLQPFLGQMLAAAQMHAYGPPTHEQIPQLQALGQMAAESGPNTELQQQQQE
ncbi:hypothetical protein CVIRNUC_002518 [Coccomyxa viridis]|uniref:AP2/ERF domain-containing protein n=1 Tax=Coccomyxa viridis TaxID=1274662 RepID=A0AAV1HXI0_9CHLO|nr:hypothetical protein CVIRNUC_002518 [Coccomyxa viridis]